MSYASSGRLPITPAHTARERRRARAERVAPAAALTPGRLRCASCDWPGPLISLDKGTAGFCPACQTITRTGDA